MSVMSDTLDALAAEEEARTLTVQQYEAARKEWEEIDARYAALRPAASENDVVARVVSMVRRYGPKAAAVFGGPAAGAGAAAFVADEGGFSDALGWAHLIGQLFGVVAGDSP